MSKIVLQYWSELKQLVIYYIACSRDKNCPVRQREQH